MGSDRLDVELHDAVQLDEIDLLASLMLACVTSETPLASSTLDGLLGVESKSVPGSMSSGGGDLRGDLFQRAGNRRGGRSQRAGAPSPKPRDWSSLTPA